MKTMIYHPITGQKVLLNTLTSEEIRSPNRLYNPVKWNTFYDENEDQNTTRLFGLEFEFNVLGRDHQLNFDKPGKAFLKLLNEKAQHIHILEDHSVRNGMEIIFHPMSIQYMKKHIDFKMFFHLVKKHQLTNSHDTGFHIHVNLKPTLRERNLLLRLFSISYPLWLFLSGRKITRIQNRYVSTEFFTMGDKIKRRHITNLKKLLETGTSFVSFKDLNFDNYDVSNRYNAINFTNPHTTEFRLFNGITNIHDFEASLNFVVRFIELIDDISKTRIDDVFDLHTFVNRTNSQHLEKQVYRLLRKSKKLLKHHRLYYNYFYLLDTHWYESTFDYADVHDYIMSKKDYQKYKMLLNNLQDPGLPNHQKYETQEIINDFLLSATYEVIDNNKIQITCLPVIRSTFRFTFDKETIQKDYVVLRCINQDLLLLFD